MFGGLFRSSGAPAGGVFREFSPAHFQKPSLLPVGNPPLPSRGAPVWQTPSMDSAFNLAFEQFAGFRVPLLQVGAPPLPTRPAQPGWQPRQMDAPDQTVQIAAFRVALLAVGAPALPTQPAKPGWQPNQMDALTQTMLVQLVRFRVALLQVGADPLPAIPAHPGWQPSAPPDATAQFIDYRVALLPVGDAPLPTQPAHPGWQPNQMDAAFALDATQMIAYRVPLLRVGDPPLPTRAAPLWQSPAMDPPIGTWAALYRAIQILIPPVPPVVQDTRWMPPLPWWPLPLDQTPYYPRQPLLPIGAGPVTFSSMARWPVGIMDAPGAGMIAQLAAFRAALLPIGGDALPTIPARPGWQPTMPPDATVQFIAYRVPLLPVGAPAAGLVSAPLWRPGTMDAFDSHAIFAQPQKFPITVVVVVSAPAWQPPLPWFPRPLEFSYWLQQARIAAIAGDALPPVPAALWQTPQMDRPDALPAALFFAQRARLLAIGGQALPSMPAHPGWQTPQMDTPDAMRAAQFFAQRDRILGIAGQRLPTRPAQPGWQPRMMDAPDAAAQFAAFRVALLKVGAPPIPHPRVGLWTPGMMGEGAAASAAAVLYHPNFRPPPFIPRGHLRATLALYRALAAGLSIDPALDATVRADAALFALLDLDEGLL